MALQKKKKGPNKKILLIISTVSLVSFLIIGLFFYKFWILDTIPQPVFEEIYSIESSIRNEIRKIDYSIYESLYVNGVQEKDIIFSIVKPSHEVGHEWDFTELIIRLPDREAIYQLEEIINTALSRLKPTVIFNYEKKSDFELICHVYVNEYYTHKIILKHEKAIKPELESQPRIAIIIDDLGYDRKIADNLIHFELPLSLSVLPLAPYTEYVVKSANENGSELLLHLPMEPKNYPHVDPGPGALLMNMSEKDIRERINDLLEQVPGIHGVNNHMGSCFTESYEKMSIVLSELRDRNLFYLDSRTTKKTVAFDLAKDMGVPTAQKNVFLDHDLSQKAIKFQMERLMSIARHSGVGVGIGHPNKETITVLKEYRERLNNEFRVVPVSHLVE